MVQELRQAGEAKLPETLKAQAAAKLDAAQRDALAFSMREVVTAKSADVTAVDQFGDRVVRAKVHVEDAKGPRDLHFLLIRQDGALRWAGRN